MCLAPAGASVHQVSTPDNVPRLSPWVCLLDSAALPSAPMQSLPARPLRGSLVKHANVAQQHAIAVSVRSRARLSPTPIGMVRWPNSSASKQEPNRPARAWTDSTMSCLCSPSRCRLPIRRGRAGVGSGPLEAKQRRASASSMSRQPTRDRALVASRFRPPAQSAPRGGRTDRRGTRCDCLKSTTHRQVGDQLMALLPWRRSLLTRASS